MAEKAGEADGMEAVRARFEQWRSSRSGKAPIPDELWKLAINVARQQGVNRAAQQLRLDAGKLKRLLVGAHPRRSKTRHQPRFVELIAPATVASPECVVEFESATGSKMRVHWKTAVALDWANLLHAWRGSER
jgi:hypothetical protein